MRQRQQEDVEHIFRLALVGQGEAMAAAILASRHPGVDTLEQATRFAKEHYKSAQKLLEQELYFGWIAEGFLNVQRCLGKIDFKEVAAFDRSKHDTKPIFENHISEAASQVSKSTSGILASLDSIFDDHARYEHKKLPVAALEALNEVKRRAENMLRLCRRIQHPYQYLVTDRRWIVAFIAAFLCAIPLWYLARINGHAPIATIPDLPRLTPPSARSGSEFFSTSVSFLQALWQFYLAVPSLLLVPAVLLGVARRHFRIAGFSSKLEDALRNAAIELQSHLPNPPSTPLFTIKELNMSTGDNTVIVGNQNNVKSTVTNSYNDVKGKHGDDIDRFLQEVGAKVTESNDPKAAEFYKKLNGELASSTPTGSIVKAIWDNLLKVLPAVGSVAGAAAAILKLTGAHSSS